MIFQLRKGQVDHPTGTTMLQSQTKLAAPWKPWDDVSLWNILKCWGAGMLFPNNSLLEPAGWKLEGSLSHKTACSSQLGCGRRQGRDARRRKEAVSQSFLFFRQGIRHVPVSFLYRLHLHSGGREEGIKRNRTRTRDAGGISGIPNLVGHPMRALLS